MEHSKVALVIDWEIINHLKCVTWSTRKIKKVQLKCIKTICGFGEIG